MFVRLTAGSSRRRAAHRATWTALEGWLAIGNDLLDDAEARLDDVGGRTYRPDLGERSGAQAGLNGYGVELLILVEVPEHRHPCVLRHGTPQAILLRSRPELTTGRPGIPTGARCAVLCEHCLHLGSRLELKCGRRDGKCIVYRSRDEIDRRRHARQELPIWICGVDDDRVRDDVLNELGLQPHLADDPVVSFVGIRGYGKRDGLTFTDLPDVTFVHRGEDLHLFEISRKEKKGGGVE